MVCQPHAQHPVEQSQKIDCVELLVSSMSKSTLRPLQELLLRHKKDFVSNTNKYPVHQ